MREIEISTDRARLEVAAIHVYLSRESYWARGRSRETVERSIARSLNFGAYDGARMVGCERAVTGGATFAWLCDVFIAPGERRQGIGTRLMAAVSAHPDLQDPKRFLLATRDAHGLCRQFGFEPLAEPERFMTSVADER
jgi:GNAT superfamily N-acetyltransferase